MIPWDQVIGGVIKEFEAKGKINRAPLRFALEKNRRRVAHPCYSWKIAVDQAQKRLFITIEP